jgi:hypothetical protein
MRISAAAVFLAGAGAVLGQVANHSVEVTIERMESGAWKPSDPRTVFRPKDEVRFQFRSSFDGYLYVLNRASSGQYMWLYPSQEAGTDNRVQPNHSYVIPSTNGAFAIPDSPGFDVVYWVLSPTELRDLALPQPDTSAKSTLIPRCRESELRARGGCLDDAAGARVPDTLPKPLQATSPLRGRELKVDRKPSTSHIRFNGMSGHSLVYEFWIAHR